jgi:hypothetical protein
MRTTTATTSKLVVARRLFDLACCQSAKKNKQK